jgi:hypothetical protein
MPVPTVAEVLKQSGLSQEQIDALDAKVLTGVNNYVSTVYNAAEQKEKSASELAVKAEADRKAQEAAEAAAKTALDAAELQKRSVDEFWNNTYNPGIAAAEVEKTRLAKIATDAAAETAWYKAQHASLKDLGFVPADAPVFTPPAAVETPKTPGTPTFTDEQINQRIGSGLSNSVWALQEYQKFTGQFLPDPIDQLAQEATQQKLPFRDYVARKYDFAGKQKAAQEAAAKAHDDSIRTARDAEKDLEWKAKMDAQSNEFAAKERKMAEQHSQNPDTILPPGSAKFTEVRRAQQAGERPDPTKMTPEARIKLTQENLRKRLDERQQQVA